MQECDLWQGLTFSTCTAKAQQQSAKNIHTLNHLLCFKIVWEEVTTRQLFLEGKRVYHWLPAGRTKSSGE